MVSECVVESSAEDECGCELGEGEVELGSSFPADGQAAVVVDPGVGAFDRPALACVLVADASGAGFLFVGDVGADAALAERGAEPVGVVAAVGKQPARSVLAAAATDAQGGYRIDRVERVHAVMSVSRPEKQR